MAKKTKVKKLKKGKKKKKGAKTKTAPSWLSNAVGWISWFKKEKDRDPEEAMSAVIFHPTNRIPCQFCNGFVPCQNPKCFAMIAFNQKAKEPKKKKKKRKGSKGKKKKKKKK